MRMHMHMGSYVVVGYFVFVVYVDSTYVGNNPNGTSSQSSETHTYVGRKQRADTVDYTIGGGMRRRQSPRLHLAYICTHKDNPDETPKWVLRFANINDIGVAA